MNLDSFQQYKGMTGIYWFWFEETIAYVGKANCILSRVKSHGERFAEYSKFEAHPLNKYIENTSYTEATCFLKLCECFYIEKFNPIENRTKGNFIQNWRKSAITHRRVYHLIDKVFSVTARMSLE
jgi:hypothetical protein